MVTLTNETIAMTITVSQFSLLSPMDALKAFNELEAKERAEREEHNEQVRMELLCSVAEEARKKDPNWVSKFVTEQDMVALAHLVLIDGLTFMEAKTQYATQVGKKARWVQKATGCGSKLAALYNRFPTAFTPEVRELLKLTDERGTLNVGKLNKGLSTAFKTLNKQITLGETNMNTAKELTATQVRLAKVEAELAALKAAQTKTEARLDRVEECAVVINDTTDWRQAALQLKLQGVKVNDIVAAVSISRSKVSAYLNQAEVKAIWNK